MPRRSFIVGALSALADSSYTAAAQSIQAPSPTQRSPRIGVLVFGTFEARLDSFRKGLRGLGYVEGRDFVLEAREARGRETQLASFARELIALEVDILIGNSTPVIEALKAGTSTVPIVMAPAGDTSKRLPL